jgi:hypothetical protein
MREVLVKMKLAFLLVLSTLLLVILGVDNRSVVDAFHLHQSCRRGGCNQLDSLGRVQRPTSGTDMMNVCPLSSLASSSTDEEEVATADTVGNNVNVDEQIKKALQLLYTAAETKAEDSDTVVAALLDLEKLMRTKNKVNPAQTNSTLTALSGNGNGASWRLIFTTGTINTQQRTGRVNYFPIKATQSFNNNVSPWLIENGIYAGDFPLLKFKGDFDWTVQKSGVTKLTFDFTSLKLLNFLDLQLKAGEAASLGAKSGLGSDANVALEKQGKRAFFNWISADDKIATARGGGGGLALWKRVDYEGGQ